ncbi:MAG TPA: hypothetical protein VF958_05400 [Thermoanaerobaculia bacterium]
MKSGKWYFGDVTVDPKDANVVKRRALRVRPRVPMRPGGPEGFRDTLSGAPASKK